MSRHELERIPRTPLYEEVATRLRAFVGDRGLREGDRLPSERELAQQLGVSRTSVRQALTALRTVGLVEIRHGDGVYLRNAQPELAVQLAGSDRVLPLIMEVREALELQIARLAARRRSEDDLRRIEQALATMEEDVRDGRDASEADAGFHSAVAQAARNPLLADLMSQIAEPVALTRRASLSRPGRPAESLGGHRRVLDAIRGGNEPAAEAAMREHLRAVGSATAAKSRA